MIERDTKLQITDEPAIAKHVLPAVPSSEVYLEDCVKALKRFNDNHFDLAIVDPPYGIERFKKPSGTTRFKSSKLMQEEGLTWDIKPTKEYWDELFRVSKNQIVWGGNYFANLLPNSQGWIFWDKGQRNFSLADGELCWTSFKKSLRVFEMARAKAKASIGYEKIHPTQKPVELYDFCLNFAKLCGGRQFDFRYSLGKWKYCHCLLGYGI